MRAACHYGLGCDALYLHMRLDSDNSQDLTASCGHIFHGRLLSMGELCERRTWPMYARLSRHRLVASSSSLGT